MSSGRMEPGRTAGGAIPTADQGSDPKSQIPRFPTPQGHTHARRAEWECGRLESSLQVRFESGDRTAGSAPGTRAPAQRPPHISRHVRSLVNLASPFPAHKLMPELPPGPSFILRRLFSWKVVCYSSFIYFLQVGTRMVGANVPLWMIVSSSIAALPALLLAQCQLEYWMNQRKARSLGARLVPTVPTRWPGGIDLIATIINVFKTGYIGELTTRSRWCGC